MAIGLTVFTGCQRKQEPQHTVRFYTESSASLPSQWCRSVQMPESEVVFSIFPKPVLMENEVTDIDLAEVEVGYCLAFQFNEKGTRELYRLSISERGKNLVLLVDGHPIGFRRMDEAISDGRLYMFVEVEEEKVPLLAKALKEGMGGKKKSGVIGG